MKSLVTVSRDSAALLTLDEAKEWLRVVGTDEDAIITSLIKGSVMYAENYLNKTIGSNVYTMSFDSFETVIRLFMPPVSAITKIEYTDTDGNLQEFDLDKTILDTTNGFVGLKAGEQWAETADQMGAVKVYYTCDGVYNQKEGDDILDAIKLVLGYHYDWRDDPNQRWKKASDRILKPLRIIPFE